MRKIFRVEDVTGIGMYISYAAYTVIRFDDSRHPRPGDDKALMRAVPVHMSVGAFTLRPDNSFNYGFKSIDQMKCWIYEEEDRQALKERGFWLVEYECAEAYYGDTQAVFIKETSVQIKHHDLTEV